MPVRAVDAWRFLTPGVELRRLDIAVGAAVLRCKQATSGCAEDGDDVRIVEVCVGNPVSYPCLLLIYNLIADLR